MCGWGGGGEESLSLSPYYGGEHTGSGRRGNGPEVAQLERGRANLLTQPCLISEANKYL